MLAFQLIKLPMDIKQTLPIGGVVVQFLSPLLEEEVAVSANMLLLLNGQPRPARGRASGEILLQDVSPYMVPRERAPDWTLKALREAGAEKMPWQQQKGTSEYNISKICCNSKITRCPLPPKL
jgi:hypothetical protein